MHIVFGFFAGGFIVGGSFLACYEMNKEEVAYEW